MFDHQAKGNVGTIKETRYRRSGSSEGGILAQLVVTHKEMIRSLNKLNREQKRS